MINKLININLSKIGVNNVNSVNSRDIYSYLELSEGKHNRWFESVVDKYDFIEDDDYISMDINVRGVLITNYIVTIDMAKELCMVSNTDKGKETRRYFINYEKNNCRPMRLEDHLKQSVVFIEQLQTKVISLENKAKENKPLVDFATAISQSTACVKIGDWIKAINDSGDINIGRNKAFKWFRDNKYIQKDNIPYQQYVNQGLFEVKEGLVITDTRQIPTFTTLLTAKGQMCFASKLKKEVRYE